MNMDNKDIGCFLEIKQAELAFNKDVIMIRQGKTTTYWDKDVFDCLYHGFLLAPEIATIYLLPKPLQQLDKQMESVYKFILFINDLPKNLKILLNKINISLISDKSWSCEKDYYVDNHNEFLRKLKSVKDVKQIFRIEYALLGFSEDDYNLMEEKWLDYENNGNPCGFLEWLDQTYESRIQDFINKEFRGNKQAFIDYHHDWHKRHGFEYETSINTPLSMETMQMYVMVVKELNEEYNKWQQAYREDDRYIYLKQADDDWSKRYVFQMYHNMTTNMFEIFFRMMNSDKIMEDDCRHIYSKLEEKGLSYYIQQRYDEYRKVTGKGRDLQFYKRIDVDEIHKALEKYYTRLKDDRVDQSFYRYLPRIIDDVIPNLKTGAEVNAFIRILWRDNLHFDKYRKKSEDNRYYPAFRDELVNIFHLNRIPSINTYSVEKVPVPDRSRDLWHRYEVFQQMIEQKQL